MIHRLRAPGKLMLAGEYSVLHPEGRALAVAVPMGVDGVLQPADRWRLERPEVGAHWTMADGVESAPECLHYGAVALMAAMNDLGNIPAHRLVLSSSKNRGHDADLPTEAEGCLAPKQGVGGSASATVLTVAAAFKAAGRDVSCDLERVARVAHKAHHRAQGGRGSGYDVWTIALGNLVQTVSGDGHPRGRSLPWPKGLWGLVGFSGVSASTRRQLQKLDALKRDAPQSTARELQQLAAPVTQLVQAFEASRLDEIREAMVQAHQALMGWDHRHQLGIITPAIEQMIHLAHEQGAVAKVSGAGAGDSIVAFAEELSALEHVRSVWKRAGFQSRPLELAPGVHVLS